MGNEEISIMNKKLLLTIGLAIGCSSYQVGAKPDSDEPIGCCRYLGSDGHQYWYKEPMSQKKCFQRPHSEAWVRKDMFPGKHPDTCSE